MSAKQMVRDRPQRVLVVEDDPAIAKMLRYSLRAAGFDIAVVAAGSDALQILEREPTDGVVLDLGLPDGLGKAVLDRLRKADDCGFPAWVVISALDRDEATSRYGPLGTHFLAKPFNPWDLIRMLAALLSESKGGQQRRRGTHGRPRSARVSHRKER